MSTSEAPVITYKANCHCGRTRFTVDLADIRSLKVTRCNCSICTRNGYLLVYPRVEDVKFESGLDELSSYCFGKSLKYHRFCSKCGTSVLIDFSKSDWDLEREVVAINIRTFRDIEDVLGELTFRDVDGKNKLGPPYHLIGLPDN
ncbi:glutathione-dependent formaldehyde-activating, GFA [Hypoxylon sp. NC0597]|nr:glutathione-dependent formaldehyde-activating, GFA [Hypoxylon sp. NC0597]